METVLTFEDSKLFDSNSKKVFLKKKCIKQILKSLPQIKGEAKLRFANDTLFKDSQKIELDKECIKVLSRKVKLIKEKEIKEQAREAKKAIKAAPRGSALPRGSVISTSGASLSELTKAQEAIKAQQEKEKKEKEEIADIEGKVEIISKQASSAELKADLDEIKILIKDINKLRAIDPTKRNKILSYLAEFVRSPLVFLDNSDKKKQLLNLLQETGLSNLTSLDQKLSIETYQPKTEKDWEYAFSSGIEESQLYISAKSLKVLKDLIAKIDSEIDTLSKAAETEEFKRLSKENDKVLAIFTKNPKRSTDWTGIIELESNGLSQIPIYEGGKKFRPNVLENIRQYTGKSESEILNEVPSNSTSSEWANEKNDWKKYQLHLIAFIHELARQRIIPIQAKLNEIILNREKSLDTLQRKNLYYTRILQANQ
jgi:hypothetical protein